MTISEEKLFSCRLGNSKSRTNEQRETARSEFQSFVESVPENSYLVYSDGSVLGECFFGEGGCGVVLTKKGDVAAERRESRKVGRKVDNDKIR